MPAIYPPSFHECLMFLQHSLLWPFLFSLLCVILCICIGPCAGQEGTFYTLFPCWWFRVKPGWVTSAPMHQMEAEAYKGGWGTIFPGLGHGSEWWGFLWNISELLLLPLKSRLKTCIFHYITQNAAQGLHILKCSVVRHFGFFTASYWP